MSLQFLRKVTLAVANATEVLDLSQFRVVFQTQQADLQTLNTMKCRVYNLSESTIQTIRKQYSRVILQGGYVNGDQTVIFDGTIKQTRSGRESETDTYAEIFAADGDSFYTYGTLNQTIDNWTQQQVMEAAGKNSTQDPVTNVTFGNFNIGVLGSQAPRGKVMYGMARDTLRTASKNVQASWNLQNGKLTIVPITGYLDTEAVVLNSLTGLIGLPQQTEDGITARCLLNPKIVIGTQVQINQAVIQTASLPNDSIYTTQSEKALDNANLFPSTAADGFYKVLVAEHTGDTRGNDYYTDITVLKIDKSAPQGQQVKVAG